MTDTKNRSSQGLLRQLRDRWQDWLFAEEDAAALQRGWQVSVGPKGWGRVYRDPRWDLVSTCDECGGEGGDISARCEACGGRGTVRVDQADSSRGGP